MLTPKVTNCKECGSIPDLIKSIDCKIAETSGRLYNNIVFSLNLNVAYQDIFDLLTYKRILEYKAVNPDYICKFDIRQITTRIKLMTAGCKPKCPCYPKPLAETTTTTTTECLRPTGLTQGYATFTNSIFNVVVWTYQNPDPSAACSAYQGFHIDPNANTAIGSIPIEFEAMELGATVYMNWGYPDCNTLFDGVFWYNPTTGESFTYFANNTPIEIITVTNGIVTNIYNCSAIE